jgi:hypothetical protein
VPALLVLVLLVGACSGDDDTDDGLGPEAPGVTVTSTTGGVVAPSSTTPVAGQDPTTETTVTRPPSTTTSGSTTTSAPGDPTATTTTDPGTDGGSTTSTTTTIIPRPSTTVDPDGPVVSIGADDYRFTVEECVYYDGVDIAVWGPGEAPDGTPVYLDMQVDTLRIDIGTQERFQEMDNHWLAGVGANDDLVVSVDGFEVTVTGTFVRFPRGDSIDGELVVDCPLG